MSAYTYVRVADEDLAKLREFCEQNNIEYALAMGMSAGATATETEPVNAIGRPYTYTPEMEAKFEM